MKAQTPRRPVPVVNLEDGTEPLPGPPDPMWDDESDFAMTYRPHSAKDKTPLQQLKMSFDQIVDDFKFTARICERNGDTVDSVHDFLVAADVIAARNSADPLAKLRELRETRQYQATTLDLLIDELEDLYPEFAQGDLTDEGEQ